MANQSGSKGNPAVKRMSNKVRAERRSKSWARGEKRKEQRRIEQEEAHRRNVKLKKAGRLTPWEYAHEHKTTAHAKTNKEFAV